MGIKIWQIDALNKLASQPKVHNTLDKAIMLDYRYGIALMDLNKDELRHVVIVATDLLNLSESESEDLWNAYQYPNNLPRQTKKEEYND